MHNLVLILSVILILLGCTHKKRDESRLIPMAIELHKTGDKKEKKNALLEIEYFVGGPTNNEELRLKAREYIISIEENYCLEHKTRKMPTPPAEAHGENILGFYPSWCNECYLDIPHGSDTHKCKICDYDRCVQCNDLKDWNDVGKPYSKEEIKILNLEWKVAALQREQNLMRVNAQNERNQKEAEYYLRLGNSLGK